MKQYKSLFYLFSLLFSCLVVACEDFTDPVLYTPQVATGAVDLATLSRNEATLTGTVRMKENKVISKAGFRYSIYPTMEVAQEVLGTVSGESLTCQITGLKPATTYYYYLFVSGGYNEQRGDVRQFVTSKYDVPQLGAVTVDEVTEQSARVTSKLMDDGGAAITSLGVMYMQLAASDNVPTPDINSDAWKVEILRSDDVQVGSTFSLTIAGLESSADYAICTFASSRGDNAETMTAYSNVACIRTHDHIEAPTVDMAVVQRIDETEVELSASVLTTGGLEVTERGFCYSTNSLFPTIKDSHVKATGDNEQFQAIARELIPGQKYYIRAYATNEKGTGYSSAAIDVTTLNYNAPSLSATTMTNIMENSATATAYITSMGNAEITERGFCFSETNASPGKDDRVVYVSVANARALYMDPVQTPDYTQIASVVMARTTVTADDTDNQLTATISDLARGTKYYIRAFATNLKGTGYGSVTEFQTADNRTVPAVGLTVLESVTETSMNLSSSVSSDGGSTVTERGFCYSTSKSAPTLSDTHSAATGDDTGFSLLVADLTPGQKYYVRAYATNEMGTGYSSVAIEVTTLKYEVPTVSATTITNIEENSVTATAYITSTGNAEITEQGFCISASNAEPGKDDRVVYVTDNQLTATISDLTRGATYYIRAFATNLKGTSYGSVTEFLTADNRTLPTVDLVVLESVTETSMNLSSSVSSNGGSTVTERGFCYSTSKSAPTLSDTHSAATGDDTGFTLLVADLTPGQKYYVRAYATNEMGTGYSPAAIEVNTPKSEAPTVSATTMTNIAGTSATATAYITSTGNAEITERGFCISESNTSPGMSDRVVYASSTQQSRARRVKAADTDNEITAQIDNLKKGTTYYIRAFATNAKGTAMGKETSFTMPKEIVVPTVSVAEASAVTKSSFTLSAVINSAGNGTIETKGFCYMASSDGVPTLENALSVTSSAAGNDITATLSALQPNTTYAVRAYARNEKGVAYSDKVIYVITEKPGPEGGEVLFPEID